MQMRHVGRCAATAILAVGTMLLSAGSVSAGGNPCIDQLGNPVPGCQTVGGTWNLKEWTTQYQWLSCPSSAPYYYGGYSDSSSRGGLYSAWQSTANTNSAQFGLRNTDLFRYNEISVTIGCSATNANCNPDGPVTQWSDPGCPQTNNQQECAGSNENQTCWNVWNETCSNGTTWVCNTAAFAVSCTSSNPPC